MNGIGGKAGKIKIFCNSNLIMCKFGNDGNSGSKGKGGLGGKGGEHGYNLYSAWDTRDR